MLQIIGWIFIAAVALIVIGALIEALRPSVWRELLSDENLSRFERNNFEDDIEEKR
jgi:hypothetical protein